MVLIFAQKGKCLVSNARTILGFSLATRIKLQVFLDRPNDSIGVYVCACVCDSLKCKKLLLDHIGSNKTFVVARNEMGEGNEFSYPDRCIQTGVHILEED